MGEMEVKMISIKNSRKNESCNSCGKLRNDSFITKDISIGIDGSGQATVITLCMDCLKELSKQIYDAIGE